MAKPARASADSTVAWLIEGDPAIRWQTLRDLRGAAPSSVHREQARVALDGWGARLLALQSADGRWTRGIYTPKWTSTTYTLLLLKALGLASSNPQALRGAALLLETGFWRDGGINYWQRRYPSSETCVTGIVLAVLSWFGIDDPRVDSLASHLLDRQMPDGGWNCRSTPGYGRATHASFHTTILALEALLACGRFRPARAPTLRMSQARGREFLLQHRLFRSHRTGKVAKPELLRFVFPPQWHYDVLRALDYFRDSAAERDPRLSDGIALLERRRQPDGRWLASRVYPGKMFFDLETAGQPSRWNTLRALRVLGWWNTA